MWIVALALRRPYTFVVMAVLIFVLGAITILRMPTDIFPEIDIPVIAVVWNYSGMSPDEMEQRIVGNFERVLVSTVNDIGHIESQSLSGTGVVKIFLQPGTKIDAAVAQITAAAQTVLKSQHAAGHHAAADHPLQRQQRPDCPSLDGQRHALRTAALRPRGERHPPWHGYRARRASALSVRRKTAPGHDRYSDRQTLQLQSVAVGCLRCGERSKSDSSRRQRESRRERHECAAQL